MAKLVKKIYYTKNKEPKINNYFAYISKDIVNKSGLNNVSDLKIRAEEGKIIIEKSTNC